MDAESLKRLLEEGLGAPSVSVELEGDRALVQIVAERFEGVSRVKRQQMVYQYLNDAIATGAIHAVTIQARAPSEI
jgi:acid stress-induced BolA-like protein IbaG/YrbA